MLTPIIAVQPSLPSLGMASTETANAAQPQPRGPISVSPLQSDVVMKIVDTLSRHFIGRDVLPPEALARLVETLAQVLKVPPLPNETTMEFARRLAAIVETMPPEVRQLAEKQLGLRPLAIPARVLAEALRNPNGSDAARIATVLETAPQAANGTGGRLGGAAIQQQAGPPVQLAAALAAVLGSPGAEVEVLQSILKATYGQEDGPDLRQKTAETRQDPQNGAAPQEQASGDEPVARGKIERLAEMLQKAMVNGPLPADSRSQQVQAQMPGTATADSAEFLPVENEQADVHARTAKEPRTALRQPSTDTARLAAPGAEETHSAAPGGRTAGTANLAGALAKLPENTIDALVERLSKALKTMEQAAPAPTALTDGRDGAVRLPLRGVPVAVEAAVVLPLPEEAADDGKPVKQAAQIALLDIESEPAERKDPAASRPTVPTGLEESRRDMNLPLRPGELAVARDIIPFAILHYLPAEAEAEAVPVPEEEEPAFPSEEDGDGEAADNGDGDEAGGEHDDMAGEALDERAAAVAAVMDSQADTADDEAYQAYIRMGGIL